MKGWHNESYRHSLAARGVKTGNFRNIKGEPRSKILADLMILRDRTPVGDSFYHNSRIFSAIEKMRDGHEITWEEYSSLRYFVDDLREKGLLSDEDISIIEQTFANELGVPLHGWDLEYVDTGNIKYTSFRVVDENGEDMAEMKMWFLNEHGDIPDWEDNEPDHDLFLDELEFADLEEEWFSEKAESMSLVDFMRQALPFIYKLTRDEGVGLEWSPLLVGGYDDDLDALMESYGFITTDKKHLYDDKYSVRYVYDYRATHPKYVITSPDGVSTPYGTYTKVLSYIASKEDD